MQYTFVDSKVMVHSMQLSVDVAVSRPQSTSGYIRRWLFTRTLLSCLCSFPHRGEALTPLTTFHVSIMHDHHKQREHKFNTEPMAIIWSTVEFPLVDESPQFMINAMYTGESKQSSPSGKKPKKEAIYMSFDDILLWCFVNVMPSEVDGSENCCMIFPPPTFAWHKRWYL